MRPLHITKLRADDPEQTAELLTLWAALGSTGLSADALVLHSLLKENARLVVSLAKQYPHPAVSPEAVVKAAHGALVDLLNRSVHRVEAIEKGLVLTLRNAMADAVQAPAGAPQ